MLCKINLYVNNPLPVPLYLIDFRSNYYNRSREHTELISLFQVIMSSLTPPLTGGCK